MLLVQDHLKSLSLCQDVWVGEMSFVLRHIMEHTVNENIFNKPVDDKPLPDYYRIVQRPMDLGTVKAKLEDCEYETPQEFRDDVLLVFANARLFNGARHPVEIAANKLQAVFEDEFAKAMAKLENEAEEMDAHYCDACESQLCALCNRKCLEFRAPSLRCSCTSKILRNAVYYRWGGERGQHWCGRCYASLGNEFFGLLGQRVKKAELEKRVNDEVFLEPWVECSRCRQWMHQICAMYDSAHKGQFTCPLCQLADEKLVLAAKMPCAADLPTSALSDFLSAKVHARVVSELVKEPANPGEAVLHPRLSAKEAKAIADTIVVRVVSSRDCAGKFEPRTTRWVEAQSMIIGRPNTPLAYPYRAKTIVAFQKRDGYDVLIYAVYVQEYSASCPEPNASKVYLSYLDSVGFLKPRRLRTPLYQEIVSSYMAWVRARGFKQCYIWACPPGRGDAYVMYCHPRWQRTPSAERLRKWYTQIVARLQTEGVLAHETTLLAKHLSDVRPFVHTRRSTMTAPAPISTVEDKSLKAPTRPISNDKLFLDKMPLFAGDFVPSEIETILAQLENDASTDLTDGLPRMWWGAVWGDGPDVEVIRQEKLDSEPFSPLGISRPTVAWTIRPSVKLRESVLVRYEKELGFTAHERDEWIMRKVAAAVRPIKDNFLVLHFSEPTPSSKQPLSASKKARHSVCEPVGPVDCDLRPDTSDPDAPPLPQTLFDTRLSLLDFMQWSHLQFDELRRAKHSSMVLLRLLLRTFKEAGAAGASAQ